MHSSVLSSRKGNSRKGSKVSGRQRLLLLVFAMLFAFVLPFICWGAYGTPGHPHQTTHFVFAFPSVTAQQLLADTVQKPKEVIRRLAVACGFIADPGADPADGAAGRSTLDTTSAVSLILLVLLGSWTMFRALPRRRMRPVEAVDPEGVEMPVPTPPPRVTKQPH